MNEPQEKIILPLSKDQKRNKIYHSFLNKCRHSETTVDDIIQMGHSLMRKEKCHPHFFGSNSLLETAHYLALFSLKLPYQVNPSQDLGLKLTEAQALDVIHLFEKRISKKIPVEYITQEAWYLGNKFYVNENVLVPRSIMNTRFMEFLKEIKWENNRVLDLCTGSGCIGITLALLEPNIKVDLVDVSTPALEVARVNINNYGLQNRVQCLQSNLFENIHEKYDLIITNPPYVSTKEYNSSPLEFKNEPKIALESGVEGLDLIHQILAKARYHLNTHGKLIAEVGVMGAKRLKKRYPKLAFKWFKYRKPTGKVSWFAMDCLFSCEAKDLDLLIVDNNSAAI